MIPETETTVSMVSGITEDVPWEFVSAGTITFRIVPDKYTGKALAGDASGSVSLVTRTTSSTDTAQLWYIAENGNGYSIMNVKYKTYLYAQNQNGTRTCSLSGTVAQTWMFMDYDVPYEVFALKNTDLYLTDENAANDDDNKIGLYLKNTKGWNYNTLGSDDYNCITFNLGKDERIACMDYVAGLNPDTAKNKPEKSEAIGDYCGFRLKPESSNNAYRIMPLSSGNGHQRALTVDIVDELDKGFKSLMLHKCVNSYEDSQLFIFEMLSDGSFVVKLESEPSLVLTGSLEPNSEEGIAKMNARTETLENQTWVIEEYMAYLPQNQSDGGYHAVLYTELENYYAGLNFGDPINTSNLVIVSDFGPRDLSTSPGHMGIDLRASEGTRLYAPYAGTVVEVGEGTKSGKYIKIKINCDAFPVSITGSKYELYIVYMHMSNNSTVSEGQSVSKGDEVGLSGSTGTTNAHLHYGVFLVESKDVQGSVTYSSNQYPLNPLMFVNPDRFSSGEAWAGVECVYWE